MEIRDETVARAERAISAGFRGELSRRTWAAETWGLQGMNTESGWLTAKEAAQYLKVEPRTLLLWARQGKVKAYALSGTARHVWRFRFEDLDAALMPSPMLLSSPSSAVPAEKEAAC